MAFRASCRSNLELINSLKASGDIKSPQIESAMLAVDRANYCKTSPYIDSPQSIGYAATISAPHMHAIVLEYLRNHLHDGASVLGKITFSILYRN